MKYEILSTNHVSRDSDWESYSEIIVYEVEEEYYDFFYDLIEYYRNPKLFMDWRYDITEDGLKELEEALDFRDERFNRSPDEVICSYLNLFITPHWGIRPGERYDDYSFICFGGALICEHRVGFNV